MVGALVNNLCVESFRDIIAPRKVEEDIVVNEALSYVLFGGQQGTADRGLREVDVLEEILSTWVLISTPVPAVLSLAVYLYFVLSAGPRFMAHRKPYDLKIPMMIYNVLQIAFNSWMLFTIVVKTDTISHLIKHGCVPKREEKLLYAFFLFSWCYFLSKLLDLSDTVFMVLRKKQSHITFLHLYHHVSMVLFTWISVKYISAHQGGPPAMINMFVHIVMYSYYFLASLGPAVRPFLWWKRYLTKLQLGQFAVVIMYLAYLNYQGCPVSRAFNYIWIVNVAVIAAFFVNFYIQTYLRKNNGKDKCPESNNNKVKIESLIQTVISKKVE